MSVPKVILIGPFPPTFIDRLTAPLIEHGAPFRLLTDTEKIEAYHHARKHEGPQIYPQFHGQDMVFLEVSREHIMLIRKDVENLGFSLKDTDFDPGFDDGEYLCPKCEYHSPSHGLCPKHNVPLLEFSAWVAAKREWSVGMKWGLRALIILLLAAAISYLFTDDVVSYFTRGQEL